MLFWHVALLFSGLCTSVLGMGSDGYGNHGISQSSERTGGGVPHGYEEFQGCWIGRNSKKSTVSERCLFCLKGYESHTPMA